MQSIALFLVATPIGHNDDLSTRARETLLCAKFVIGEEFRDLTTVLKKIGRPRDGDRDNELDILNEHSTSDHIAELTQKVIEVYKSGGYSALVSDCGTPGFCDPGALLVAELRRLGYRSSAIPGASSLMCLLALAGERIDEFVFRGFLPAERAAREKAVSSLQAESRAIILMDTPYRLEKLLGELSQKMPERLAFLACNLTAPDEETFSDTISALQKLWAKMPAAKKKAEFILLLRSKASKRA